MSEWTLDQLRRYPGQRIVYAAEHLIKDGGFPCHSMWKIALVQVIK